MCREMCIHRSALLYSTLLYILYGRMEHKIKKEKEKEKEKERRMPCPAPPRPAPPLQPWSGRTKNEAMFEYMGIIEYVE